ncbi:acyl-CoA dehydrogenase, partial [Bacillus anthracis]
MGKSDTPGFQLGKKKGSLGFRSSQKIKLMFKICRFLEKNFL